MGIFEQGPVFSEPENMEQMHAVIVRGHTYMVTNEIKEHLDDIVERYLINEEKSRALDSNETDKIPDTKNPIEMKDTEENDGKYESSLYRL
jgi:hypothetical protein